MEVEESSGGGEEELTPAVCASDMGARQHRHVPAPYGVKPCPGTPGLSPHRPGLGAGGWT